MQSDLSPTAIFILKYKFVYKVKFISPKKPNPNTITFI